MLYVAAISIKDPNRRRRVKNVLREYGFEVLPNIYECLLEESLARRLESRIKSLATHEDRVRLYRMCRNCLDDSRHLGDPAFPDLDLPWIF